MSAAPLHHRALQAFVVLLGATLTVVTPARAQQTIINAPSVDQTPQGKWFALHESQIRSWDPGRYWQTTHFLTYGVTSRVEAAVTVYNVGTPLKRFAAVGLGWKTAQSIPWLAERAPGWEPKIGAGQMLAVPLRGERVGVWSYAQASVRTPASHTRLTAGISDGPAAMFGKSTTHFVGSIEQPLAALPGGTGHRLHNFTLLAEWWSGKHEFGDLVAGANWHRGHNVVIMGYKWSNLPGTKADALVLEVGRTF